MLRRACVLAIATLTTAGCELIAGIDERYPSSASSSVAVTTAASTTGAGAHDGGAGGEGGAIGGTMEYLATVAECLDTALPTGAADCERFTGRMLVDGVSEDGGVSTGYVRFEIDGAPPGSTSVAAVELHLFTTVDPESHTNHGGSLWQVSAFTVDELMANVAPNQLALLAVDIGTIRASSEVVWTLNSPSVVALGMPVCLAIMSESSNGTYYWNLKNGVETTPKLVVTWR